eukprot:jgi/Psemu1/8106/gm1.8106_g
MPVMLHRETDGTACYSIADILTYLLTYLAMVASSPRTSALKANHNNLHPGELAVRLLRDFAVRRCSICSDESDFDRETKEQQYEEEIESVDVLARRIRTNDPKLTTLALRNTRLGLVAWNKNTNSDRDLPLSSSSIRGFSQNAIPLLTEALRTNHTIRSISCRYDLRYPRTSHHHLCDHEVGCNGNSDMENDNRNDLDTDNNINNKDDDTLRPTSNNILTKVQERRFFEACVCLPRLESISLTGGNRWRISHLVTILETAKGLKRLTVRDVLIKTSSELYGLKRVLLGGGNMGKNHPVGHGYGAASIPLEAIELTIEDQTDRSETYWNTDTTTEDDESPFDELLQALAMSTNIKTIRISKSILSRLSLRPAFDLSTATLLKLAECQSLSKLVISGLSVERGAIEAMCEALIERNGHLTQLEFSGCAFNHTVGQSGWNAMFRLVNHDPAIQIRASSLLYLRRQRKSGSESDTSIENTTTTNNNSSGSSFRFNGEETVGRSGFIQRPREDFSFSLRDREEADRHFQNRGLDVEYMLQEAGFFRLLQVGKEARDSDWIDVMAKLALLGYYYYNYLTPYYNNPLLGEEDKKRRDRRTPRIAIKRYSQSAFIGSAARAVAIAFGLTASPMYKWLKFGRKLLLCALQDHPAAKVCLPNEEETQQYVDAIAGKYPALGPHRVWGACNGLKLHIQQSGNWTKQNPYYNGWTSAAYVNSVFLFCPDGRIRACILSSPGSWHDSTQADYGLYEKTERMYELYKAKVVVDSIFKLSTNNHLLRSSQYDPLTAPVEIPKGTPIEEATAMKQRAVCKAIAVNRTATNVGQMSEWGMRQIQGGFPRLKDNMLLEETRYRRIILKLVVLLYSFQTAKVGINTILNTYMSQTEGFFSYGLLPTETANNVF